MIESIELVIFDCDGVLVDSELLAGAELDRALCELFAGSAKGLAKACRGLSLASSVQLIESRVGQVLPANFLTELQSKTYQKFRESLKPVDGVAAILDMLDQKGIKYCVASSGSHEKMAVTLGVTGLKSRFEGLIFSATEGAVAKGKPEPDLFLYAAQQMRVRSSRSLVIEDAVPGVQGAIAAGMRVVGYSEQTPAGLLRAAGAETADSMQEVKRIIGPWLASRDE